jgi:YgiT-type zinc finger domain-containing protein
VCTIIEVYSEGHRPLPDCLVPAWLRAGVPLHPVIAIDAPNDRVFGVTVYRPDPARWFDDWTRGRSQAVPLCGGRLSSELATIPFVLGKNVAVIKQVPAEVCDTCGEPFLYAEATDVVSSLLDRALASKG